MSARERKELWALEKMSDRAIDTSDIPEITDFAKLRRKGWRVIRIWQHQIDADLVSCIAKVENAYIALTEGKR